LAEANKWLTGTSGRPECDARTGRTRGESECGDHRQPERQGRSKRGSALDPQIRAQHLASTIAILHVGGMDDYTQQEAERIDKDVALASLLMNLNFLDRL